MCLDIEAILGDEAHRFSPVQSKEKFGAWRFYWRLEPTPEDAAAQERAETFTLDLIFAARPRRRRKARHRRRLSSK